MRIKIEEQRFEVFPCERNYGNASMNAEIRQLLNKARRGEQLLSGFWLLIKFRDLHLGKQGTNLSEGTRIKQISKWLKEKGFRLRKVRNTGYYSISKLK